MKVKIIHKETMYLKAYLWTVWNMD